MSGLGNLLVPYMHRGEFAETLERCAALPQPDGYWREHPLSENGDVWVEARARAGLELSWAAAISRVCGGFCIVWWEVPAVFYAGQRLNGGPSPDFASCFAKTTGLEKVPGPSTLNGELSDPPQPQPLPEVWTRAAFMFTRPENAAAATGPTTGWDWSSESTPIAGIAIVLMDRVGVADPAMLSRLSEAFDTYGAAVEIHATGSCRSWWLDPAAQEIPVEAVGASKFLDEFSALAMLAGEGAGCLRRPRHVPGPVPPSRG